MGDLSLNQAMHQNYQGMHQTLGNQMAMHQMQIPLSQMNQMVMQQGMLYGSQLANQLAQPKIVEQKIDYLAITREIANG